MRKKDLGVFFFIGLFLAASLAAGRTDNYRLISGTEEYYYGHISLVDIKNDGKDPMVLREGMPSPELATLNLPLGPGDTIITSDSRRCEIQFDNGTVIRLDLNTELKIETIMAQSLSARSKISNLVLRRGALYAMYKEYGSQETFQVITPATAVKLKHNAVATISLAGDGAMDLQVAYGKAIVLYGSDPKDLKEKSVYKNEKFSVRRDSSGASGEYSAASDFELWNKTINDNFEELHRGITMIPKPIQRLNPAVFYFAQQYGNMYGEWLYDDYFGYVWRPFMNDMRYPSGSWSPYFAGRWSNYNGQMFWVASEPWGWVPYHLGVWQWNAKRGWYWIPGSAFAPAWVDWAFFGGGYYAWRPWSMWDWGWYGDSSFLYDNYFGSYGMYGNGSYPYYWGPYGYYGLPGAGQNDPVRSGRPALTQVSKDQLQKPGNPTYPMPKEFNKGLKSLLEALKKGDVGAIESLRAVSKQSLVVNGADIHAPNIHGRIVKLDQVMLAARALAPHSPQRIILSVPPRPSQTSAFMAARTYDRNTRWTSVKDNALYWAGRSEQGGSAVPAPRTLPGSLRSLVPGPARQSVRVHDWNPDVRIGARTGLEIRYVSQRNEIYCPQLRISSSMIGGSPVLTSEGRIRTRSSGGDSGRSSSNSGGSSGGSVSSGGSASSAGSAGSSSSTSSSGGGGGHIRN